MNETDFSEQQAVLMAIRDGIASKSSQREELWITQTHEQIEAVQLAGQREFVARTLEREANSLTQIRAALKRIDDGEYGTCLDCEEPISAKRLAAVPWAAYCLRCQEIHDAREAAAGFASNMAA